MKMPEGALIARILPNGPADQAGIKTGDIILSYNGQELATSSGLPPLVGNSDPGDSPELAARNPVSTDSTAMREATSPPS